MSRLPILRAGVLAAPLLFASGCASLGGNVKGSFACRAPEGTRLYVSRDVTFATQEQKVRLPQQAVRCDTSPINDRAACFDCFYSAGQLFFSRQIDENLRFFWEGLSDLALESTSTFPEKANKRTYLFAFRYRAETVESYSVWARDIIVELCSS